jgi:hypothetical protein
MGEVVADFDFDQDGRLNRNAGGNPCSIIALEDRSDRNHALRSARKGWLICRGITIRPSP